MRKFNDLKVRNLCLISAFEAKVFISQLHELTVISLAGGIRRVFNETKFVRNKVSCLKALMLLWCDQKEWGRGLHILALVDLRIIFI